MKRKMICVLILTGVLGVCGCSQSGTAQETDNPRTEVSEQTAQTEEDLYENYESRIVTLGAYKGLTYTDNSDREPTDEEVEEEMNSLLDWFDDGEMTDSFVQENLGFDSIEEFRKDTRSNLKEVYAERAWKAAAMELFEKAAAQTEFEMSKTDMEKIGRDYTDSCKDAAKEAKMSFPQYLKNRMNLTEEEFKKQVLKSAKEIVQVSLLTDAIVETEELDVEASYNEIAGQLVNEYGYESIADMEAQSGKAQVERDVKYRMAAQYMMDNGNGVSQEETEEKQN